MVGKTGQAAIESAVPTAGSLHAQAAMEYLMTYGWALLVIVIVIAILLIMNPFSAPQSCRFDQVGFTCENPALEAGTQQLFLKISNGNNNAVTILGLVCTSSKSATPPTNPDDRNDLLGRQETYEVDNNQPLKCVGAPLGAGSDFSGKLWVFYKNQEDGNDYPTRSASANLVTKVV